MYRSEAGPTLVHRDEFKADVPVGGKAELEQRDSRSPQGDRNPQ